MCHGLLALHSEPSSDAQGSLPNSPGDRWMTPIRLGWACCSRLFFSQGLIMQNGQNEEATPSVRANAFSHAASAAAAENIGDHRTRTLV